MDKQAMDSAKATVRKALESRRRALSEEDVARWSAAIAERLCALPEWAKARTVLLYYPIRREADMRSLLERYGCSDVQSERNDNSKTLLLPEALEGREMAVRRYEGPDSLTVGRFGIPEPQGEVYDGPVDLVVVPGVGFDPEGHRLGRGGGYYDTWLARHPEALKVAVAYDFQIVEHIPAEPHDARMDMIVSPEGVIR